MCFLSVSLFRDKNSNNIKNNKRLSKFNSLWKIFPEYHTLAAYDPVRLLFMAANFENEQQWNQFFLLHF